MLRFAVLVLAAVFCVGCVATYRLTPIVLPEGHRQLPPGASLLVGVSADGAFEAKPYHGSGNETTTEVVRAFSRCGTKVEGLREAASLDDGVAQARSRGFTYYLHPTILHWEDRATEWSGKRDKISIRLQVIEIETGRTVSAVTIEGKSKWATFGGDHPQELLADPLTEYAKKLCP